MSDSDAERVEWMDSNPSKFPFSVYPPTRHDILFDVRRSYLHGHAYSERVPLCNRLITIAIMLMMCIGPEMEIPSPKATCVRRPNGAFALQAAACVTLFAQGAAAY